jgi:hypothetical protein
VFAIEVEYLYSISNNVNISIKFIPRFNIDITKDEETSVTNRYINSIVNSSISISSNTNANANANSNTNSNTNIKTNRMESRST